MDYEFVPVDLWKKLVDKFGSAGGDVENQRITVKTYECQPDLTLKVRTTPLSFRPFTILNAL